MKIAVIAANGRSGQAFVQKALDAGHQVRGGILGKSYLPNNPNLTTVDCDATNPDQVKELIAGCDAVVSLIGHVKGSPAHVQTQAISTVIDCMKSTGVTRIVSLTGTGVRFPGDKITLLDRFLNLGISIVDPNRVKDGIEHVKLLEQSDVDWTVIRVLKLQNVAEKPFTLRENGPTKPYVGRDEVASAILQVLEQNSFVQKSPIISK